MTAPGQAPTTVSRPKTFGEGSRVKAMHENVAQHPETAQTRSPRRNISFTAQAHAA